MRTISPALLILGILGSLSQTAHARPEYAVQLGMVNCTACHVSPTGGGHRNVNGKLFGTRNLETGETTKTDLYYADLRAMAYYPTGSSTIKNGLAMMEAIPSVNIPVIRSNESTLRAVMGYSLGVSAVGARDIYLQWQLGQDAENRFLKYFKMGRFVAPFGLLTDEHRTYTRIQSKTSINDYEMGFSASGDPLDSVHYDLALTQGFQSGGMLISGDMTYALTGNIRWEPFRLPFFVGTSLAGHRASKIKDLPYAWSVYEALSIDRLTGNRVSGSLLAEVSMARGWNDATRNPILNAHFLASDPAFAAAIADSTSLGFYVLANWDIHPRWRLFYKFDEIALDRRYLGDAFIRHGAGVRIVLNGYTHVQVRYEATQVGRAAIKPNSVLGAVNDVMATLHFWL